MKSFNRADPALGKTRGRESGSVLVITLWVAFGLVTLALYFGNSNSLELRTADQRAAGYEAEHVIEGAARYATYLLSNLETPGVLPEAITYSRDTVPVGEGTFWFIGRDPQATGTASDRPYFALVDESSRLNLNTATAEMLQMLPGMTSDLAAAIIDWRDTDSNVSANGGAEDDSYLLLQPPYRCKNSPFESIMELRLVRGMDLLAVFGEDTNLNGVLDENENDGPATLPDDDHNGRLDAGFFEYITVYSRVPNTRSDGTARINITQNGFAQRLTTPLQQLFSADRANQILRNFNGNAAAPRNILEFYRRSQMTQEEFVLVEDYLTITTGEYSEGLVNVNTASEAVLACIPGIGTERASSMVAYRQASPTRRKTVAWVADVLDAQAIGQAGRYLTGRSYQVTADIAATGHLGRGYRRSRFLFDISGTTPRILYRQDLSHLGWALGTDARRQQLQIARNTR